MSGEALVSYSGDTHSNLGRMTRSSEFGFS